MTLRREAVDAINKATAPFAGFVEVDDESLAALDGLLDWLEDKADEIAEAISSTPGARSDWFNHFHAKALVSVLRKDGL